MKTVKVAAAIILEGNKFMAAQRNYGEFEGGWEFPGGKLELNETSSQACVREIREELGVVIDELEYLTTVEYDYSSFHLSMDCFFCKIIEGTINLNSHSHLKWLTTEDINSVNWLDADKEVIQAIQATFSQTSA